MTRQGSSNRITDVPGLKVGCAHDTRIDTGVTVVLPDQPAVCAVMVAGGGPGTRETDALDADRLVDRVDAVTLSGGSVYGLAAADGVTARLGAQGRGFSPMPTSGAPCSPIVPAAILYDLANGGDKAWGEAPPYRDLGARALDAASVDFALGRSGAGHGARAGAEAGGLGSASLVTSDGISVGAIVAVNCFGAVRMPGQQAFWAWPYEINREFGGVRPAPDMALDPDDWGAAKANPALIYGGQSTGASSGPEPGASPAGNQGRENTTIALVATDVTLTPAQAKRVAQMAVSGLSRAIRPVFAPFDGDVVFAMSTARQPLAQPEPLALARIGELVANCLARAVARGVHCAAQQMGR